MLDFLPCHNVTYMSQQMEADRVSQSLSQRMAYITADC